MIGKERIRLSFDFKESGTSINRVVLFEQPFEWQLMGQP